MNTTEAIKEYERRLAVMRAHAEGRAIQIFTPSGRWVDRTALDVVWDWDLYDYRIKPEPVTLYLNIMHDRRVFAYSSYRAAKAGCVPSHYLAIALPVTLPEQPE